MLPRFFDESYQNQSAACMEMVMHERFPTEAYVDGMIALAVVALLLVVASYGWYLKTVFSSNRNLSAHPRLTRRSFPLTTMIGFGSLLCIIFGPTNEAIGRIISCHWIVIALYLVFPFMVGALLTKTIMVLRETQKQTARLNAFRSKNTMDIDHDESSLLKFIDTNVGSAVLWTCMSSPYLIGIAVRLGTTPLFFECNGCQPAPIDVALLSAFGAATTLTLLAVVARWFAVAPSGGDPLGFAYEIALVVGISCPLYFAGFILASIDPSSTQEKYAIGYPVLVFLGVFFSFIVQVPYQTYVVHRQVQQAFAISDSSTIVAAGVDDLETNTKPTKERFEDVLHSETKKDEFAAHLAKELSLELLLFYDAVIAYQASPTQEEHAKLIDRFVRENAPDQVNLSASMRDATMSEDWKNAAELERARDEVVSLMRSGAFQRFGK